MIYHLTLFKLHSSVTPQKLDEIILESRIRLLKVQGVNNLKVGKNIDPKSEFHFFVAMDIESPERLELFLNDALYLKYVEEILKPNTMARIAYDFNMDSKKSRSR
ncbi:MAG: Dabb family protein [Verrucomicrobiae bacterium]|nr:Dabb family protein [Verrucomicrobiae bacterium]